MPIAGIIVAHTPLYVWAILALLLVLGFRRLKPRRTHLGRAALAPLGFLTWSAITAASLLLGNGWPVGIAWASGFLLGMVSAPIRTVPRPVHVEGWVFDYSATRLPLILYMLLFLIRYALGIWAGFVPVMADTLALAGLFLSALTAGRTFIDFLPPLRTALEAGRSGS
jgi:hypothetical protein